MSDILFVLLILAAAVLLLKLLFRLLRLPIRAFFKLLIHAAVGFIALFVLNFLGSYIGLYIEMNWVNAAVTGVLGVPGVLLLLLVQFLF